MNRFKQAFIDFIVRSPKKTLGAFFLFTLALSFGLTRLHTNFSYKVWYDAQDPMMKLYESFERNFGNDDAILVGIHSEEGIFSPKNIRLLDRLTQELYQVSDIIRVDSVLNFHDISAQGDEINIEPILADEELENLDVKTAARARKRALSNEILAGAFVNEAATFTVVSAQIRPASSSTPDYVKATAEANALLEKLNAENPQAKLIATGPVVLTDAFRSMTINDIRLLVPLLYAVFTVILIVLFRSVSGVLLPYLAVTFSTVLMLGTMGFLGFSINSLSSAVPTILLTVALADAVHILTVFYLGQRHGFSSEQALRHSLNKNFYPTLLTTITTALGFLSFFDAKIKPVSELGIAVGVGAFYAWIASYALLGPLLAMLPKKRAKEEAEHAARSLEKELPSGKAARRYADFTAKHAKAILISFALTGAAGLYFCKDLAVNMDPVEQFPEDHPVAQAYRLVEEKMGFIGAIEIMIKSPDPEGAKDPAFLRQVEKLEDWLRDRPYVKSVLSVNAYLKKINQAFHGGKEEYYRLPPTSQHVAQELFFYSLGLPPEKPIESRINAARDAVRVSVNWTLKSSRESNRAFRRINGKAKELGLDAKVTGKIPLFHDLTPYVVETFAVSLTLALVTITLALSLILRSLKLGLFAMAPSVLPLMAGGGVFALLGHHVNMGTVLVASVCLGIAVDDSVHFMFAYKGMIRRKSFRDTIASIATNVFPSLLNTTVLLVFGFSSFLFGDYVPNAKFGVSAALILVFALVCDFLMLPALLAVLGSKKPLKKAASKNVENVSKQA